ncbi:hypothetical protein D0X99_00835 [Algoriphagus lacus]|uniref:Uncharacterized protein n=1 Tax=Algoriphagus lacus TaxID=2056311 RepID=A0A418PW45_9BACT|nr:hypothetical protein [Algoriphagus lacus]RIW18276.1 hypothetical protein D0X99_00835 [Algoriphagus lacus]
MEENQIKPEIQAAENTQPVLATSPPKRNLISYFKEFLMLFLAVFCGFLAENYRDNQSEIAYAKEYAKSLIQDLENDTIMINGTIEQKLVILKSIDSISEIIHQGVPVNGVRGSFYYHSQMVSFSPTAIWNDATLIQITQSGNLRYFKNAELVNKISEYYSRQGYLTGLIDSDKIKRNTTLEIKSRILNNYHYRPFSSLLPTRKNEIADSLINASLPLQNSDKDLLNAFANSLENRKFYFMLVISETYPLIKSQAHELILALKKEYNIE